MLPGNRENRENLLKERWRGRCAATGGRQGVREGDERRDRGEGKGLEGEGGRVSESDKCGPERGRVMQNPGTALPKGTSCGAFPLEVTTLGMQSLQDEVNLVRREGRPCY